MVSPFKIALLGLWLVVFCSTGVIAAPVTWRFSAAGFSGGGGLTGSFVYDASSNTLSGVAVLSGPDGDFSGSAYTISDPSYGPYPYELALLPGPLADATGAPVLDLYFDLPLTDAGGTIRVAASEYPCADAGCTYPGPAWRFGDGYVTTSTGTAEPGPGTLLGAGFLLVGLVARQRSRQNRMREPTRKDGPGV